MNKSNSDFRILVVDDDRIMLRVLTTVLRAKGFEVVTARHGMEATQQYDAYSGEFKAVLNSNGWPEMKGLTFAHHLRSVGFTGLILVMGTFFSDIAVQAYNTYQVSGFLKKPFPSSDLVKMLSGENLDESVAIA